MNKAGSRRAVALVTLVLTATLTSCGGGGGGGSTPPPGSPPINAPAPGGGNTGGSATPNPGGTPPPTNMTPAPVNPGAPSSPTPSGSTPTPAPAPGTSTVPAPQGGITILPDTTGRFSFMQMADQYGYNNASLTTSQIQSEAPNTDAVWAAFQQQTWSASHSGPMILSRYVIPFENMYLISQAMGQQYDLNYFLTNHPSWILYGCDQNGNPTTHYAWSGSYFPNDVPLNIHDPNVRAFQMQQLANYLASNGYNAVAIDQVAFVNFLASPNPILENNAQPQSRWFGCGVYTQGVQNPSSFQYVYGSAGTSDLDVADNQFIQDELTWVQDAKNTLGAMGISVLINHPPVAATPSGDELTLLNSVDGVVDEQGFTNYGQYTSDAPNLVPTTLSWVQAVQNMHKAVWLADYYCPGTCNETSATQLSTIQADWALSTYAIANNGGLGLYVAPQGVGEYGYRPEFSQNYGAPCASATQNGSVFMRRFQKGLALVNTSPTNSATATLPSGNTYTDIEGRGSATISGSLPMGPADGWMLLLSSGTGCPASGSSTLRHGTAVPGVRRP